jgi:hypothetical protein
MNGIGSSNTFTGSSAGGGNMNGANNTFSGNNAGVGNITGSNNTALGSGANMGSGNLTNATAIGQGAVVGTSNTVQLGNSSVTLVNTSGNVQFSGALMPNGLAGTIGQVLTSQGTGTAPTWTTALTPTAGVEYNVTTPQNTATPGTNDLFNVAYTPAMADASTAGAVINSTTTGTTSATGLTVTAQAAHGTVTALIAGGTGGTTPATDVNIGALGASNQTGAQITTFEGTLPGATAGYGGPSPLPFGAGVVGYNPNNGDNQYAGFFEGSNTNPNGVAASGVLRSINSVTGATQLPAGAQPSAGFFTFTDNGDATAYTGAVATPVAIDAGTTTTNGNYQALGGILWGTTSAAGGIGTQAAGVLGIGTTNFAGAATLHAKVVGVFGEATAANATTYSLIGVDGLAAGGNTPMNVGGYFSGKTATSTNLGVVGQVNGTTPDLLDDPALPGKNIAVVGINAGVTVNDYAGYFEGKNTAADGRVLVVTNDPTAALVAGGNSFATESRMNYPGAEITGSVDGAVGGSYSLATTSSANFQAQGAMFEAHVTNGTGAYTHAVGGIGSVSGDNSATPGARIMALAGEMNFGGVGNNFNGIGVFGFDASGANSTTGRTAGGVFNGTGGATEFGAIGQVGGTNYQAFNDATLLHQHIGVVGMNYNNGADQHAGYFAGTNNDANGRVLVVTNDPTGTVDLGGNSFATESRMNYPGIENTGVGVGGVGGSYSLATTSSADFQAQGAMLEAQVTNGTGVYTHAIGGYGSVTGISATADPGARIVALEGETNFPLGGNASNNFNGIAVFGYNAYDGNPTLGRAAGGEFDGTGGATEFGVIGEVGSTFHQAFQDATFANNHIAVVGMNYNTPSATNLAGYFGGNVTVNGEIMVSGGVTATTGNFSGGLSVGGTAGIVVPVGTTAQEPSTPVPGTVRLNSTTGHFEGWNGTSWRILDNY